MPSSLTPTEFDLLLYLAANRKPRRYLPRIGAGSPRATKPMRWKPREVIRPHVSNLRRKLRGLGEIDPHRECPRHRLSPWAEIPNGD